MNDGEQPQGPAPDFGRMREGFNMFADEVQHLDNIPVIQGNSQIMAALDVITKSIAGINSRLDGIDSRLDGIDDRLDGIDGRLDATTTRMDKIDDRLDATTTRIDGIDERVDNMNARLDVIHANFDQIGTRQNASDHNNMAYTFNTMVRQSDWGLMAFHDANTNQVIPDFPVTHAELEALTTPDLNIILDALNLSVQGEPHNKKQRLQTRNGLFV